MAGLRPPMEPMVPAGEVSKRTAMQVTVTIPEGAPPGSLLSIPVHGKAETIKARVPEGLGPGSTLVLTQVDGTDEWTEEVGVSTLAPATQVQTNPMQVIPGAVVGLDLNSDGIPDLIVAGPDFDRDGIPDALQQSTGLSTITEAPAPGTSTTLLRSVSQEPLVQDPGLVPSGPVAYTVRLDTSAGVIDIIVRPDWAPHGARRLLELAAGGDLDGLTFYRSVKGCLAQFGLPTKRQWKPLPDDPPTAVPFLLGAVCFAAVGKNSRKSTLFICIGDMSHCFGQSPWETPIGAVAEASLDVLDRIETIYGDIAECGGSGPNTGRINAEGDEYLQQNFPLLTRIHSAKPLDWPPTTEPIGSLGSQVPVAAPASPSPLGSLGRVVPTPVEPVATTPEPTLYSEPAVAAVSSTRPAFASPEPAANGSDHGRTRAARQKEPPMSARGPGSRPIVDVPVEVVAMVLQTPEAKSGQSKVRSSPSNHPGCMSARQPRNSLPLDVPVEVCSARPRRPNSLASSGAKTARSTSRGGIMRVVASPQQCDSPVLLTNSQASSISMISGGGLQPLGSGLNRSLNLSFEQQAQAMHQAHAQAQVQRMMGAPAGPQGFGSPLASAPLGTFGSLQLAPLDSSTALGSGTLFGPPLGSGLLGPQSPPLQSPPPLGLVPPSPLGLTPPQLSWPQL